MTSAPVTAGVRAYFNGQATAATSTEKDVESSFSDVLKGQENDVKTEDTAKKTEPKKSEDITDKVTERVEKPKTKPIETTDEEVSTDKATKLAEKAAEELAGEMLQKTAEELGITVEEVVDILNELSMTPMDLLNVENLQRVVLTAAGETDAAGLLTNEELFGTFKNLTDSLQEVIAQVQEETGLTEKEVEAVFEKLANNTQDNVTELNAEEMPTLEMPTKDQQKEASVIEVKTPVLSEETKGNDLETQGKDGAEILLDRKLSEQDMDNQAKDSNMGNNTQNPFAENLLGKSTVNADVVLQEVPHFDADTELILNQITDYMKGQITDGVSELEMQLHPENLGSLHVRLTAKEGVVTANFTAQNETVKNALESQMIQLKETFKEQGITVEAIEVTVESHKFDQNLSQNSGSNAGNEDRQPGKSKTKRINLNLDDLLEDSVEDGLSEEEQLAAKVLRDNGGTVDYMA